MKKNVSGKLVVLLLIFVSVSCSPVDRAEKAAIIVEPDFTLCGGCGGWIVSVDSVRYRADVNAPYNHENKSVWIRFRQDESSGQKKAGNWIVITSIRNR